MRPEQRLEQSEAVIRLQEALQPSSSKDYILQGNLSFIVCVDSGGYTI